MNYVEPIRNLDTLENMCSYLKKTNERNYLLFMMVYIQVLEYQIY